MKVQPLADRVLVEVLEGEAKTEGGIFIPDTAQEKTQEGKVVSVGPGKIEEGKLIPVHVKAGDKIIYDKFAGTQIKVDGKDHLILKDEEILATIS